MERPDRLMRLIHLSDLHYSPANARRVAALLNSVSKSAADHLIISGDLTASARADEFRELRSLLDAHGLTGSDKVTVIAGNHDILGLIYQTYLHSSAVIGGIRGLSSLTATARNLWRFRRRLRSYNAESYRRDLASFRAHFPHAFARHITTDGHVCGFPFARLLPGNVALIGVDTNHYLPRLTHFIQLARMAPRVIRSGDVSRIGENLSGSTGYMSIESLTALLNHPDVHSRRKILVMHHYLYNEHAIGDAMTNAVMQEMRLVNRGQVIDVIRQYHIELVLHGHWHVTNAYRAGGARVLNGGGSLEFEYHQIDVDPERMRITAGATPGRVRM